MSLNDFIFGKVLGKGSFGTVNIVTRKLDNKIYAMKRVNIGSLNDKDVRSSLNEVRILASLNHPNIISYKEAFFDEDSKTLNIVMEFAEEGDVEQKVKLNLKNRMRFKEDTIWEWLIQILEGLKYLHDNKIMHRDLKCANIFITKNGILKLGDLNVSIIAKMGMAKTQTGTPYYCSPEIWLDRPYDYKSDIWSLGCIIYELCQLRPPFRGTNLRELSRNVMRGFYLPISNYYSQDLKNIIAMMLVVDANNRACTDDILQHPILQKRIQKVRKIIRDIETGRNKKVNFMKTIKLPRNMKDINSKLPKKRYKPEDEMLQNDEYETTKATFYKELKNNFGNNDNNENNDKKNNINENNFNFEFNNIKNNNNINNNGNYMNNNRQLMNNYIRNNEILNDNRNNNIEYYRQQLNMHNNNKNQQYNNPNKYAYLNKYDNNMKLKFDDEDIRSQNQNRINNNNNNYNNYYNIYKSEKGYNYHYNEKINNFDMMFNNDFEKKYNANSEKNKKYIKNINDLYSYNNPFRNNNNNNNGNNGYNNINNMIRQQQPQREINKYFQMDDKVSPYQNRRREINDKEKLYQDNSSDSDIIKEERKIKKNKNLIDDYLNQINIGDDSNKNNYYNKKDSNQNQNLFDKNKYDLYHFDYNKINKKNSNYNENKNNISNDNNILNINNDINQGIKEHEIEKELENDKTKDLKQQMAKNQDLFNDLLNNINNENKMNIEENELFKVNLPQNGNNAHNNIKNIDNNIDNNINENNNINFNNIKNNNSNPNNINKNESMNNNIIKDKNNIKEKNNNKNQNKNEINLLLHDRIHNNKGNRKNNNYNNKGKNANQNIIRGITPNHVNRNSNIQYNNNFNNKINNNVNKPKNPIPVNKNKKEENKAKDKDKQKFNEIAEMFPIKNKIRYNKNNMRPGSGKPRGVRNSLQNNNKQNDYSNYNNKIKNNNYNYNINYNNNNINNYNNIYINNINNNDKYDYNQIYNNKYNIRISYNPQINNNKAYIMKKEQPNDYQIFNKNFNNKFEFKYEPIKRNNNKICYEKFNYDEYIKKNKNNVNLNDLFNNNNAVKNDNNIPNKYKNNYNGNKNININKKNIKNNNLKPRIKTGGGRKSELYKKFGFI